MKPHIYKVTNLINGKVYVGQHNGAKRYYFASGTLINRAIKKYGKENFDREIIVEGDFNADELNNLEIKYIKKFKSYYHDYPDNGYNLTTGGEGNSGWVVSDETKDKLRASMKKVWSDDSYKQRLSEASRGQVSWNKGKKIYNESFTQKMSGENNPMYGVTPKNAKIVINLETGIFYDSVSEACSTTNYGRSYFGRMLSGNRINKTPFIQV